MKSLLSMSVKDIMTTNPICSYPDMIMTEVADIFENNTFHHLPIIDESGSCIGILSKSDYHQLQDKFTKFGTGRCEKGNTKFFASLLASEVMTPFPLTIDTSTSLKEVIDIFLKNEIHSIVVNDNDKFRGIVTPYDVLQLLSISPNLKVKWQEA